LPIIEYDGLNVVVTFLRTSKAVKGVANKALGKLTEEEFAGYEWIKVSTRSATFASHSKIFLNKKLPYHEGVYFLIPCPTIFIFNIVVRRAYF
jgi:hypothetical protein